MASLQNNYDTVIPPAELERLRPDFEREAARLNEQLAHDEVLQAKLKAGHAFSIGTTEPAVRPYVSHVLYPGSGDART
jgi:hypothetical protein